MKSATIFALIAVAFAGALMLTAALEGCALTSRAADVQPEYPPGPTFEARRDAGHDAR